MENNEMQWNQTAGLLASTLKDLQRLYARICFADLGKLPEGIGQDDIGAETRLERREVPEKELFFDGLLGIYHGLNYAWATRHVDLTSAERDGGASFEVSPPTDGSFTGLVPANLPGKGAPTRIGDRPVSLPRVRVDLHTVVRTLAILCYRLSTLPGVEVKIERPKGLDAEVEKQPFDEAEFELLMFRVYSRLNEAWNCRFGTIRPREPENCQDPAEVLSRK